MLALSSSIHANLTQPTLTHTRAYWCGNSNLDSLRQVAICLQQNLLFRCYPAVLSESFLVSYTIVQDCHKSIVCSISFQIVPNVAKSTLTRTGVRTAIIPTPLLL